MKKAMFLTVLLAVSGFAQDRPQPSKLGKILYRTGQVALVVANAFDVSSSWGKHEMNPLLASSNGTFGARAATIKIGIVGAGMAATEFFLRKQPKAKPYIGVLELGVAGIESAVAVHNLSFPQALTK